MSGAKRPPVDPAVTLIPSENPEVIAATPGLVPSSKPGLIVNAGYNSRS